MPSLTPQAIKYDLACAEVNAILHVEALIQGRNMVWSDQLEAQRAEIAARIAQFQARPAIDTDAWFDPD